MKDKNRGCGKVHKYSGRDMDISTRLHGVTTRGY